MLRALLRLSPIDWGVVLYLLPFGVIPAIVWLPIRAARKRSAAKTA